MSSDQAGRPTPSPYDPQTLLNSQPVMVAVIDPATYRVQFQNQTGLDRLGNLSGQRCYDGIAKCSAPCNFCRMPEAVASGKLTSNEVRLPDDQYLLVQWTTAPTEDGRLHVIETINNITERKRSEHAAHRAQKMEALSRLAGGVVQDLNNLLTVLQAHTQVLLNEISEADPRAARLHHIRLAGERAAGLAHKLTAFTHHQVAHPDQLNVTEMLRDMQPAIQRISETHHVSVTWDLDAAVGPTIADRTELERTIVALVNNACDAMPSGGRLFIGTKQVTLEEAAARDYRTAPGDYAEITITDTGTGMTPDVQAHLFEPFFTTKPGVGAGLGLASAYGIVRQFGGYIDISSDASWGTTVRLALPKAAVPVAEKCSGVRNERRAVTTGRILLVEDDADVRTVIGDILRHAEFDVTEATDGAEGLQCLHREPFDLVITDMVMPRMTGVQLIQQIHHLYPRVKVLLMTAFVGDAPILPKVPTMAKPFKPSDLLQTIGRLLE